MDGAMDDGWTGGWINDGCGERMATAQYETLYAVRPGRCRQHRNINTLQAWHYVARRCVHATTDATWCHAAANNCLTAPPLRRRVLQRLSLVVVVLVGEQYIDGQYHIMHVQDQMRPTETTHFGLEGQTSSQVSNFDY